MTDLSRSTPIQESDGPTAAPTEQQLREQAIARLKRKREFRNHLFVYVVVNLALWVGWFVAGVANGWAFPWPVFPTVFWGVFVLGHAYDVYRREPLREALVQREVEALRAASRTHPLDD